MGSRVDHEYHPTITVIVGAGAPGGIGHGLDGDTTGYDIYAARGGSGGTTIQTSGVRASQNGEAGWPANAIGAGNVGAASLAAYPWQFALGGAGASRPFGRGFPGAKSMGRLKNWTEEVVKVLALVALAPHLLTLETPGAATAS